VVKLVITTSSIEIVKAKSQPDRMAGAITGRVTSRKTCQGRAPKSISASSMARSADSIRDWTMVVTNTIEKVICASVTVVKPREEGQPTYCAIKIKKISEEIPVITSGITKGAVTRPENKVRPRNLVNRAKAMPAIVPKIVAMVEDNSAISSDSHRALPTCAFDKSVAYHFVENPPQTVASRDPLNE
jgi:stage V sporulation protein SpoVS